MADDGTQANRAPNSNRGPPPIVRTNPPDLEGFFLVNSWATRGLPDLAVNVRRLMLSSRPEQEVTTLDQPGAAAHQSNKDTENSENTEEPPDPQSFPDSLLPLAFDKSRLQWYPLSELQQQYDEVLSQEHTGADKSDGSEFPSLDFPANFPKEKKERIIAILRNQYPKIYDHIVFVEKQINVLMTPDEAAGRNEVVKKLRDLGIIHEDKKDYTPAAKVGKGLKLGTTMVQHDYKEVQASVSHFLNIIDATCI